LRHSLTGIIQQLRDGRRDMRRLKQVEAWKIGEIE
jgi:hypothetical protein